MYIQFYIKDIFYVKQRRAYGVTTYMNSNTLAFDV